MLVADKLIHEASTPTCSSKNTHRQGSVKRTSGSLSTHKKTEHLNRTPVGQAAATAPSMICPPLRQQPDLLIAASAVDADLHQVHLAPQRDHPLEASPASCPRRCCGHSPIPAKAAKGPGLTCSKLTCHINSWPAWQLVLSWHAICVWQGICKVNGAFGTGNARRTLPRSSWCTRHLLSPAWAH